MKAVTVALRIDRRCAVPDPLPTADDRVALDLLIRGFQVSSMLRVVADLDVADRVPPEERMTVEALAAACGVQPLPLLRMLRALAALAVFDVTADGKVGHTSRSRLLRADAPRSFHHAARFWAGPGSWGAWGRLDAAMTGGVPHVEAWGMGRYDYLRAHPEEARSFDAMMANFTDNRHEAISAAYDFAGLGLIADIGGGNGEALRAILRRFPDARGLVFDLADVVEAIPPAGLLDGRIRPEPGSFFETIPAGADAYLLICVLHNWSDEDCLKILRACRAAMKPSARLLIADQVLQPEPSPSRPTEYLVDMQMMAMFGAARERNRDDFAVMLSATGLTLRQVIPTEAAVSIVEAVPAP
jgi:hypothetical protein